jgi:hypothetical protein
MTIPPTAPLPELAGFGQQCIGIVCIVSKERIGALASIFRCYRIIRNPVAIAISTKAKVHIAK